VEGVHVRRLNRPVRCSKRENARSDLDQFIHQKGYMFDSPCNQRSTYAQLATGIDKGYGALLAALASSIHNPHELVSFTRHVRQLVTLSDVVSLLVAARARVCVRCPIERCGSLLE
jgi:hypothetical protein